MNVYRARLAAPLLEQAKVLKKEVKGEWAWLRENVHHPEFNARMRALHGKQQRLLSLRKRISNIASGKPERGHAEGTWPDPSPK